MRLRFALLLLTPTAALAQAPAPAPAPTPAAAPAPAPAPAAAPAPTPAAAPAPAVAPALPAKPTGGGPEASTGFQMHFVPLLAFSFPFGDATDNLGDSLSARYGWQWMPLEVGLGAKLMKELYVGGYFNVAVGSEGGDLHTGGRCEAGDDLEDDVSCSASSVHLGLELRYTFSPAERVTGWIGYGAGITVGTQSISDAGQYSETSTAQGYDFARLTGGMDFRASRGFGLGPYAAISLGRYTHQRTEIRNIATSSGEIEQQAMHAWLSVGLRMVIFP